MILRTAMLATALLVSTNLYAQTNQNPGNSAQGVTSGPAAGSPTSMMSPQAGQLETRHQRKAVRDQSQSVRHKTHQSAHRANDEGGATGSSTPNYAQPPR